MEKRKIGEEKIRAYALKNAVEHDGKAIAGSVLSPLFVEGLKKEEIKGIMPRINKIVSEVNKLSPEEQKKQLEKLKNLVSKREVKKEGELPELPGAKKGKVIMRIAPSPSGPLHVMHAVVADLSYLYVKKYGGKFYVRIEDTNPENIYAPAYKMIEQESKWLFEGKAIIVVQSDRMKLYYRYIEELINKEAAYVCICSQEKFKKLIERKKACPCRNISTKENQERWEKMLSKGKNAYKEGDAVLRFKSSIDDPNPAMRDFPLARINLNEHPRQGKKYRVWPLMNLAVAVDDLEQGMTHLIRGKDHKDNAKRQEMIYKVFGKKYPWSAFIGRINFKEMTLSTSQTRKNIEAGKYSGWDDPRLPFIASLRKRGYKPEAFMKMAGHIGISEVDKVISMKDFFEILDRFNKT